ncbi:TetR family transcriptional regulator [Streptomyces sp. NPDC050617]|uniref:TetR/AcrR family transcriptional regulator n=1 Tax=Streptomyces sp. NPDC050617 TaxID=3154628 RepID=UPI003412A0FE
MSEETGLRERKKQRTRRALSETAIELFLKRGFDQVSVADVAAAAEVSKPTLFRYFPAKEDLVLYRIADHQGESARVVRDRAPGVSPLAALRAHLHARLDALDPITGLSGNPAVRAYTDMVYTTPSLLARMVSYTNRDVDELTAELLAAAPGADASMTRLAAGQILLAHRHLAHENWRHSSDGPTPKAVLAEAHAAADRAYDLLTSGLGPSYG